MKEMPSKLRFFMQMLMKEARRNSLVRLCESWEISEKEMDECIDYLEDILDMKI